MLRRTNVISTRVTQRGFLALLGLGFKVCLRRLNLPLPKRVLLLTGSPGVGKTTVLLRVVEALGKKGYKVGGMVSREVRLKGFRVGFEIIDLTGCRRGWLAHENLKGGPRVGKYGVNLEDLEGVGVEAILKAVRECDVVAIDEIGPMELFSESFKEAVRLAVESVSSSSGLSIGRLGTGL